MLVLSEFKVDVVVVGAGIAGLRAALSALDQGASVMVIAKGPMASSGVIGFNAPVGAQDSPQAYFGDIYKGGMGIGDPRLIHRLAEYATEAVGDLEALGVVFERHGVDYHLMRALGCSLPRLVHQANCTGRVSLRLMKRALKAGGVDIRNGISVIELLTTRGAVNGVLAVDRRAQELLLIHAGAVVLATGGGGGLYAGSTYPAGLVGDGYALAYRAGAELVDMEFVQFEPCHCIFPRRIGLSTTLLASGGQLRNASGQRFVLAEYPDGEGSAPKDALSRLIALEVRAGRGTTHGGVLCDLRNVPVRVIREDHSAYFRLFLKYGIDLRRDLVEVGPAPHTFLGGVATNDCCESGVPGLFAAGEVMGGLHGANRLGGNAGSECYVFGAVAGTGAARWSQQHPLRCESRSVKAAEKLARTLSPDDCRHDWNADMAKIRQLMTAKVGVVREEAELCAAVAELEKIERKVAVADVRTLADLVSRAKVQNMALTGLLVAQGAWTRQESRGVHYRIDYPQRDDNDWRKTISFVRRRGRIAMTLRNRREGEAA